MGHGKCPCHGMHACQWLCGRGGGGVMADRGARPARALQATCPLRELLWTSLCAQVACMTLCPRQSCCQLAAAFEHCSRSAAAHARRLALAAALAPRFSDGSGSPAAPRPAAGVRGEAGQWVGDFGHLEGDRCVHPTRGALGVRV